MAWHTQQPKEVGEQSIPIAHVVKHQRANNQIKCGRGQKIERLAQISLADGCPVLQMSLGMRNHVGADIERQNRRTVIDEPLAVDTRTTASIEHMSVCHCWQECEEGWAVVEGIMWLAGYLRGICVRELVIANAGDRLVR